MKLYIHSCIKKKLNNLGINEKYLRMFIKEKIKEKVGDGDKILRIMGNNDYDSHYYWNENIVYIALKCYGIRKKKERKKYFIESILHEIRHWIQCKYEGVTHDKLSYVNCSKDRVKEMYESDIYEKQCREWEKLSIEFLNKYDEK